jgi:hypothetical protein
MKATIKIPKDKADRHHITVPIEIWEGLKLRQGDLITVDIELCKKGEKE